MKSVQFVLMVVFAGLLGACSSSDEKQLPPAELVDFKAEIDVDTVWTGSVGDGQGDQFYRLQAAIAGDTLYAASVDGDIKAFNKTNGRSRWSRSIDETISGGVAVADGRLFIGTVEGQIIALNADDGSELWRKTVGGEILAPAGASARLVVVQTFDGRLVALNANDGAELWTYTTAVPVLTLRSTSTPMLLGDRVFAGFASGKVVAIDQSTGKVAWERRVAIPKGRSEIDRIVDVDGPLLESDGVLFAVSYQGKVMAMDPMTGRMLWEAPGASHVGLAAGFGNVYEATSDGKLLAYGGTDGGVRWERSELARRQLSDPVTLSSYVVVGDFEGYIHLLSQVDGHMAGRDRIDGDGIRAPMLVDSGMLYIYGNSGKIAAIKLEND